MGLKPVLSMDSTRFIWNMDINAATAPSTIVVPVGQAAMFDPFEANTKAEKATKAMKQRRSKRR